MKRIYLTNGVGTYVKFDDGSNRYVQVKGKKFAHDFKTRQKAERMLKSGLRNRFGSSFKIVEDDDGIKENAVEEVLKAAEGFKNEPNPDVVSEISKRDITTVNIEDVKEKISNLKALCKTASDRLKALSAQLSISDSSISDIEHYIELTDVPDEQCVDIVRMLQRELRQRREVKDEHQILSQLGGCSLDPETISQVEEAIRDLKSRAYTPKVLKELFKGGERNETC